MEGGIHAWKGLRATGAPDAGMAYFDPAKKPEELIALAWMLEEGSCKFYLEMGKKEKSPEAVAFSKSTRDAPGRIQTRDFPGRSSPWSPASIILKAGSF
jgi:hypothetical protein